MRRSAEVAPGRRWVLRIRRIPVPGSRRSQSGRRQLLPQASRAPFHATASGRCPARRRYCGYKRCSGSSTGSSGLHIRRFRIHIKYRPWESSFALFIVYRVCRRCFAGRSMRFRHEVPGRVPGRFRLLTAMLTLR